LKLKTVLIISAVTTPLLAVILILHGEPLKNADLTPRGILDLEFARTVTRAAEVYNAWKPDLVMHAIKNTFLDFLFLISYGIFLSSSCFLLSRRFTGFWKRTGKILAILMIVAASFDVFENITMFRTLGGNFNKEVVAATFIFASIKFILAAVGLLYIATSLAGLFISPKTKKSIAAIHDTNFS
jgi:hypothetical protein